MRRGRALDAAPGAGAGGPGAATGVGTALLVDLDEFVELSRRRPTPEALALVAADIAREHRFLPLSVTDGIAVVVAADPSDDGARAAIARLAVTRVEIHRADRADVEHGLNVHYRIVSADDEQVRQFWAEASPQTSTTVAAVADAPIIQLVNRIITQAHRDRSSDIHIEPTDGRLRVRYRVDGALREVLSLPLTVGPELVSRLKVMADMDIVERRRPQDGQFQTTVDGHGLDVRVATGATIWGETAVLRLLDKSRSLKALADLGMPDETRARYLSIIHRPYGMIVCSGPTGAGKTTTLYATLAEINRDELNVMTIEDPVEYVFPAANQMQINLQADITFASGLKTILRQDPDVILVGEIRDHETARIAVQSSLTGHLVMSSIHATDATSALYRFVDMGIEPFLVATSLVGVVGQRLVRRVCTSCADTYVPSDAEMSDYAALGGPTKTEFVRGGGCEHCAGTGFRGRIAVYEVMEVTEEIGQLVVARTTPHEVREAAVAQGMRPMRVEAAHLIANNLTTIDEVHRNVFIAGSTYVPETATRKSTRHAPKPLKVPKGTKDQ